MCVLKYYMWVTYMDVGKATKTSKSNTNSKTCNSKENVKLERKNNMFRNQ